MPPLSFSPRTGPGILIALLAAALTLAAQQPQESEQVAARIVSRQCLTCHAAERPSAGLNLSSLESAIRGGQSGQALVPGDPDASLVYSKVAKGEMPLGNPLPAEDREAFRRWIEKGAPWGMVELPTGKKADRNWWSLQPLKATSPPDDATAPEPWRHSPIDRWIFAEMAKKGLQPGPEADRRTLIRRACFDLIGLPPSPEEIDAFVADPNPNAYESLIDTLLASPRYGERWARHWLDVVRFGESDGYEQNRVRNNAWPFRDYVIRSLNQDKPFDQMVLEHLAGDLVAAGNPETEVATAFLVSGPHDTVLIANIEGKRQQRANDLDDMVSATASAFLGLTVHCARCHDHKFDPISQEDYYRMQAVFDGVEFGERPWAEPPMVASHASRSQEIRSELEEVEQGLTTLREAATLRLESRKADILERFPDPVDSVGTEETFPALAARYVRMTITAVTKDKDVAVLDELEVWTAGRKPRNVALSSLGAQVTARSTRKEDASANTYGVEHIIDGRFDRYWWSDEKGAGQVTIELPGLHRIDRVFWSRDRQGAYGHIHLRNVPVGYVIEVSTDGEKWQAVADTHSRLPYDTKEREEFLLVEDLSEEQRVRWDQLAGRKEELDEAQKSLEPLPMSYSGIMSQPKERTQLDCSPG